MRQPVRVLVVDDSALMRKLIPQIIERDPSIRVVATAMDGAFALKKIEELQPDVVTLDLEMPRMDGMEALRAITRKHRLPVIVVSAHSRQGAAATFRALALGAFDFVAKPHDAASAHMEAIADELISKIKMAARKPPLAPLDPLDAPEFHRVNKPPRPHRAPDTVVAMAASTGGPNALHYLLSRLPADFPAAIVIVQHMPEGFTEAFARRLDESCAIEVKEAAPGDVLVAGRALVCPGNRHMKVCRELLANVVTLSEEERVNGHRPSADVLFNSVAEVFGPQAIAVIMTGMGEDGAEGLGKIKQAGGFTLAQSEESCVVYGMPKAAIERGHAVRVVTLQGMPNMLVAQFSPQQAKNGLAGGPGRKEAACPAER